MRVKVSHTVDFENIPNVIRGLIQKSQDALDELSEIGEFVLSGDLGPACHSKLLRAISLVALLDEIYEDSEGITKAYLINSAAAMSADAQPPAQDTQEGKQGND